jgi:hypothetical protein
MDPGDCRNPNFTSPEGDWAAGYYSDDNGTVSSLQFLVIFSLGSFPHGKTAAFL